MRFGFIKCAASALRGRALWLRLKQRHDISSGIYVLLLADDDKELNEQALRHIDDLIAYRHAKGVIILTTDDWVASAAKRYSKGIIEVARISVKDAEAFFGLYYYYFYTFSEQFIVVTLTRCLGNDLSSILGFNGVTKEDLVCLGMYIVRNWQPLEGANG